MKTKTDFYFRRISSFPSTTRLERSGYNDVSEQTDADRKNKFPNVKKIPSPHVLTHNFGATTPGDD